MKIGILLPNWIGDVVMATPTLRAIRKHYGGQAEIAGIMRPYVSKVLAGTQWLDRSFYFDRKSADEELRSMSLLRQLRAWKPDTMVLLPNSLWGGVVAWMSGARERVGYGRNGRGVLLTKSLRAPREHRKLKPVPAIDYYLELAYSLGCQSEPPKLELATLPEDETGADAVWHDLVLEKASRVIIFNTGSASGTARNWPEEAYVSLAKRIVEDPNSAVLLICGPAEREAAARVARKANHPRVKSMADQDLSIGVAKACVRRSQLMVTTDSGPRHYGPAFDVPTITLSGPIDPRWSASHHPDATTIQYPVDCGPCGKAVCPFEHHRCMRGITVDTVFSAVESQLAKQADQRAA
jgi:heptosyltransferase-2